MSDTELLPKSKAEAVRRLEVFTGAGRPRAWSVEQKGRIVAESYACGEAVSVVARIDTAAIIRAASECAASGWE